MVMPRNNPFDIQVSRDYAFLLKCKNHRCPMFSFGSHCTNTQNVTISTIGVCEFFQKHVAKLKREEFEDRDKRIKRRIAQTPKRKPRSIIMGGD